MSNQAQIEFEKAVEEPIETESYEHTPIYVRLFDSLEDYTKFNRYFLYVFVAICPYFTYLFVAYILGLEHNRFTDYWVRLNFSGWMFGSFLFMNYIYDKTISIYPLLSYLADTPFNRYRLHKLYDVMFLSRMQTVMYVIVGLLTTGTGVYLGLDLELAPKIFIIISSFFAGYVIGFGLWYSFGLAHLIRSVGKMKNVKMNSLNPTYSIGVFEIPRLSSAWSMCFFCEAVIVYVGLLFPDWNKTSNVASSLQVFWLIILLILSIFNFIASSAESVGELIRK